MEPVIREMTSGEVEQHAHLLHDQARRVAAEVKQARTQRRQMPRTSIAATPDASWRFEHWRRWLMLAHELRERGSDAVADLETARIEHWEAFLDPARLRPQRTIRSVQIAAPLLRQMQARSMRGGQPDA